MISINHTDTYLLVVTQLTMEDRHTVSDPRPVDNTPSWEIDILRDGLVIVDTILLNNSTLPPRKNKRGKVLWRLPDSLDRTVSSL